MAHHEISPGQIRGLLLLLVLGPLIPTALMLRMMLVSVEDARTETHEQMEQAYAGSLSLVTNALLHQWENSPPAREEAPEKIVKFYHNYLEPGVIIRVLDENDHAISGNWKPHDKPVAATTLKAVFPGWKVELYPQGKNPLVNSTEEQIALFAWPAVTAVLANLIIAGVAGFAVHRQMRMQELKNSTLATVTHEFKTPLASMRVLLDTLLEGRYRGEAQLREYLELAVRENHRLSRLIENFLTLSRIERGIYTFRKEPANVNEIVESALHAMNLKMTGTHVESQLAENLPRISADRDSLAMAIVNLLENAWKYTGEEKKIVIATKAAGQRVLITVEDNGIGITREEQAKIFNRFYQVDQKLTRSAEGCGLGLSIVKQIVQAHGGTITVESTPGKGSVFTVSIPCAPFLENS